MAKSKKEFNREAMYKKIMPSINKIEEAISEASEDGELNPFEGQIVNVDSKIKIININSKVESEDFDDYQEVSKGVVELADGSFLDNSLERIVDKVKRKENFDDLDIKDLKETNAKDNFEQDYKLYEFEKIDQATEKNIEADQLLDNLVDITNNDAKESEKRNVNLVELALNEKLDHVLDKFDCCKCEECKNDIKEIVLNTLPEIGFTGTQKEINDAFKEFKTYDRVNVSAAIIKAIVSIRKKRQH